MSENMLAKFLFKDVIFIFMEFINILNKYKTTKEKFKTFFSKNEFDEKELVKNIAFLSHELKTPISSILGFCDIILNSENDLNDKKYVQNIRKSASYMNDLVENILEDSKNKLKITSI